LAGFNVWPLEGTPIGGGGGAVGAAGGGGGMGIALEGFGTPPVGDLIVFFLSRGGAAGGGGLDPMDLDGVAGGDGFVLLSS